MLRLLALGHTNQEIAKMLYISVRTAETHRAHIMQKLGLSSRAELVRHALSEGCSRKAEPSSRGDCHVRSVDVAHTAPVEPERTVGAHLLADAVRSKRSTSSGVMPGVTRAEGRRATSGGRWRSRTLVRR